MRYFFSTGEASGELAATLLAREILRLDSQARFEGIGGRRMRESGFTLWRDHTGWASFGPFDAIPRIPKMFAALLATAAHIARAAPDLVVLVDFGAFNVRLAQALRRRGFRRPILDLFPPGTWLDSARTARAVSSVATPLTAFTHQRDFYRSLGLPIAYFGHPLLAQYTQRESRPIPPPDGGTVALLPGSRDAELRNHIPVLAAAARELKTRRASLRVIAGAANLQAERAIRAALRANAGEVEIVHGARDAIVDADAAWVASGTAVLECVLSGVPAVVLYIVSLALEKYVRRIYGKRFFTIPNLVLGREVVPELVQSAATPRALADAMDAMLRDPNARAQDFALLREALGPADALPQSAALAVRLAKS